MTTPKRHQPNLEVARILAQADMNNAQGAAWLTERLGRKVEDYHLGRAISGERAIKVDEIDALRELAAPGVLEPAARFVTSPLTETAALVPLFSADVGGSKPLRLTEDGRVGMAPMHPSQRRFKSAFAFLITEDALGDRLRQGDTAFGVFGLAPVIGQPCVVERGALGCVVGLFDRRDANTIFLKHVTPPKTVSVPIREVTGLHAIVGVTFENS